MNKRNSIVGRVLGGLLVMGVAVAAAHAEPFAPLQEAAYFVRAKPGAVVRNFEDRQANAMRTLQGGELMRAHGAGMGVGFLEVEVAGGLEVWVYGQYLNPSNEPGVLTVTTKGVNMRPKASSGFDSMPITTKLQRGDVVRLIKRQDPSKSMSEDWVRVWSPQTARGFVLASQTERVANEAEARTAWKKTAVARVSLPDPITTPATGAGPAKPKVTSPAPKAPDAAHAALAAADDLYSAAKQNPTEAGLLAVVAAYRSALEAAPEGSTVADIARRGMSEAQARAELAGIRGDIAQAEDERLRKLEELRKQDELNDLSNTVNWGRFHGRGWVESRVIDGEERCFLRWGGDIVAEVTCSRGRYDLASLKGFELGVQGATTRAAMPASAGREAQPRLLDVYRLEVISGTGKDRKL